MPKIKLTKTELKKQRDSLKQFARFLPTLQLKKQQLQMEIQKCRQKLAQNEEKQQQLKDDLKRWISLFGDDASANNLPKLLKLLGVDTEEHNIAGVKVPVFTGARFEEAEYDLFVESPWIDDAIAAIRQFIEVKSEHEIIEEQHRRIAHELRVTTQRVNLFEKVKIPECKENIRVIQIYLGDMDTAAVGRSKIAKRKLQETAA